MLRNPRQGRRIPIIFLTAKSDIVDKSIGFRTGADDYVTKPFFADELLLRIEAHVRRHRDNLEHARVVDATQEEGPIKRLPCCVGDLEILFDQYEVRLRGEVVSLTAKEFEILRLFLQNPRKVYTKEQIYSLVWNDAYLGDENAVNVHISRLRNKIEDDPRKPAYILTVWGIGYKLGAAK